MTSIRMGLAALLAAATAMAAPLGGLRNGEAAPGFALPAEGGRQVSLADFRGKVVLINFWATWCGPCRKEMPVLEQLNREFGKRGVALVGVNVEPDSSGVADYLKSTPVSFPILFDTESKVSKLYQVQGMPNTVILDRTGKVRYIHRGYRPGEESEYLDQIRNLMRE